MSIDHVNPVPEYSEHVDVEHLVSTMARARESAANVFGRLRAAGYPGPVIAQVIERAVAIRRGSFTQDGLQGIGDSEPADGQPADAQRAEVHMPAQRVESPVSGPIDLGRSSADRPDGQQEYVREPDWFERALPPGDRPGAD